MKQYNEMRLEDILQPGKRVAFYARYSTKDQGYEMQKHSVEVLLERYGCEIKKEYVDAGVSATKVPFEERPHLQKLICDAADKKFDCIVVYKNDRIARQIEEHDKFRKQMFEMNMHVVVSSSHELYTVGEIVPQTVKDGLTRIEAALIQERTKDTFHSKAKRGAWLGGKASYGYEYRVIEENNGGIKNRIEQFVDVEQEQQVVKEIYRLFELGFGFQQIADEIKNKKWDERIKWTKERIRYIITNPFYSGLITMNRYYKGVLNNKSEWIKGKVPNMNPIFSQEYWEYIIGLFEERKERKIHSKDYSTPFLLRNILYCEHCKESMTTKNQEPGGTKSRNKKEKKIRRIYDCKNCNFKLQAEMVHEQFRKKYLPYVLEQVTQGKKDQVELSIEKRLRKELSDLRSANRKLETEAIELNQQIEELNREIKLHYEKEIIQEEVLEFMKILMSHRSNKMHELNVIKDNQDELKKRMNRIEQTIKEKKYLPSHDLLSEFAQENVNPQKLRAFLLQFFKCVYITSNGELLMTVNNSLIES
ncbi:MULTISPECIES: recombinase family protein [Bacillus]|uniref:recombinase family protein n=1 Tax=Bacillus TaxID=1386 RepID=UPI001F0DCE2E|nr:MULTISPECIES: recombinase family protein [Bacillus]